MSSNPCLKALGNTKNQLKITFLSFITEDSYIFQILIEIIQTHTYLFFCLYFNFQSKTKKQWDKENGPPRQTLYCQLIEIS